MRPSPHRHTLAVLRTFLGLTQKEMADLIECSRPTIQAIELKKLSLSSKLADRIRLETGISLPWLLGDRPDLPPVDYQSKPYTKELFDRIRADSARPNHMRDDMTARFALTLHTAEVADLLLAAFAKDRTQLCSYKLSCALRTLRKEFGGPGLLEESADAFAKLQFKTGAKPDLKFITIAFHQAMLKLCRKKGVEPQRLKGPPIRAVISRPARESSPSI